MAHRTEAKVEILLRRWTHDGWGSTDPSDNLSNAEAASAAIRSAGFDDVRVMREAAGAPVLVWPMGARGGGERWRAVVTLPSTHMARTIVCPLILYGSRAAREWRRCAGLDGWMP